MTERYLILTHFILLALVLLNGLGCTIQPRTQERDPALTLFVQVLEAPEAQRTQALALMETEHTQSPWTLRAKQLNELLIARDAQERRIRELDLEMARQSQENRTLEGKAERLREDLAKLRQIIIDIEKRAKPL